MTIADEVGRRLLPAFNSSTGLPHPRVRREGEEGGGGAATPKGGEGGHPMCVFTHTG